MKQFTLFVCIFLVSHLMKAQVLIGFSGQTPHPTAALEIRTNNLGLLLPRLTRQEITAIANPAEGLVVYNTTNKQPAFFDGISWRFLSNSLMTYPGSGANLTEATARLNFYRSSGYRGIAPAPPVQWNDTLAYAMYKFAENKVLFPTGSTYFDNSNVSIFQYPGLYAYTRTVSNAARTIADPVGFTVSQVIDLWMNDSDILYAQALMGATHKNFGIGRYQSTWYIILGQ